MANYRDQSGIPNTCPKIDEVISAIKSVGWSEDEFHSEKCLIATMEEIRSANSSLRDWGNEQFSEKENAESDRDYHEKEVAEKNEEIKNLKSEIKELENQIEQLQEN